MLYESTLRNLWKNEYNTFLKKLKVEKLTARLHTHHSSDYSKIISVIKEEIINSKSLVNEVNVDRFLFDNFFYNVNSYHYIYRFNAFFEDKDYSVINITNYLKKHINLKYNEPLIDFIPDTDFKLCTTRIEEKDNIVEKINILIYVSDAVTKRGKVGLYASVQIDLGKKLVAIKFNLNILEQHHYEKMYIIDRIIERITDIKGIYKPLGLNLVSHNETQIRKTIHNLFKELSEQAETLLNDKVPRDTEANIKKFLKEMNVSEKNDYIKQVKAVIYQDISETFNKSLFNNGWVFRFVFREGDTTRASSTTDNFEPIYSKKVYWNLKEMMFKSNELIETGVVWNTFGNLKPVAVKLEQKSNVLIVQYYQIYKENRKEKEDFVLQKINRNLP